MLFKNRKKLKDRIAQVKYSLGIIVRSSRPDVEKILTEYYRKLPKLKKLPLDREYDTLSSTSKALGDSISGASFMNQAYLQGKKRYLLTKNGYNHRLAKFYSHCSLGCGNSVFSTEEAGKYDLGNGNLGQQFMRALNLIPSPRGTAEFVVPGVKKQPNLIGISFTTGSSAFFKTNYREPRQLFPENRTIIQDFINENPYFEFVEFGKDSLKFDNVRHFKGNNIEDSIVEAARCELAIVLNSGFMHIFSALNTKTIVLCNIPKPNYLYLPCLRDTTNIEDLGWFNASNVHLHQEGGNEFVEHFDKENLKRAIYGDIYPYWSMRYLDLIYDKEFA